MKRCPAEDGVVIEIRHIAEISNSLAHASAEARRE
jgi:hypothetical protein